jgi:hypothetical protein
MRTEEITSEVRSFPSYILPGAGEKMGGGQASLRDEICICFYCGSAALGEFGEIFLRQVYQRNNAPGGHLISSMYSNTPQISAKVQAVMTTVPIHFSLPSISM